MSIFSNQQKQPQTNIQQAVTPVINPDVLGKFGLTQEDVNTSYQNLEVGQQAIAYYSEIASGQISFADPKPIKLGEIAIKPQVKEAAEVAESLFDQVEKMEVAMNPEDLKNTKVYLATFAESFGQKALEAKDWKTTVISYDLATEGGIIQAPQILQNLNELFKDDKETRIKIVELIQQRIDNRGTKITNSPRSAATTQTPEPSPTPGLTETIAPATVPAKPDNQNPISTPSIDTFPPIATTQTSEPLVQPVGTPTSTILGETTLRPAPPNPANTLP